MAENQDQDLTKAFPKAAGVTRVSWWPDPLNSRYLLAFGRLLPEMFVPTWGVAKVTNGEPVGEPAVLDPRPSDVTRAGVIAWLVASDVDPDTACAMADAMVVHHPDLFNEPEPD